VLALDDPETGMVTVQATSGSASSQGVLVEKQEFAPAFFMSSGALYVVAQHADGTPVGSAAPAQPGLRDKDGR
jgi:uncharacterized protein (TIGR03437 family)